MGYTHYFQLHEEIDPMLWGTFTFHVKELINEAWDIATEGEINEEVLVLNGVGAESHETLFMSRTNTKWEFCKTNRKPYDELVTAILILARYMFPSISVSSDGTWEEWREGRELFTGVMFLEPAEGTVFGNQNHNYTIKELI